MKSEKRTTVTIHENLLETILRKSVMEVNYREEFYTRLLEENLVVLTDMDSQSVKSGMVSKQQQVNVRLLRDGRVPVFTSVARIIDNGMLKEEVSFIELKGKDLFNLAKGRTFILNPYSDYGKELLPGEIACLLNDTEILITENGAAIRLTQPANYPITIINALQKLFCAKTMIKKAYLGWISNPSSGQPPHYIFAMDIENEVHQTISEAGKLAKQFLKPSEMIDFIRMENGTWISDYFKENFLPFYEKKGSSPAKENLYGLMNIKK
ncbi:MAG TPA: enhanced serine sensitivity protein SseB C-terminal domain-containing protein [Chitinophagales bacterium]|nr:enhanced serine sensitivity protein SseB C-terminal domain-containing protein [Chitinophagales bacterium]